MRQTSIFTAKAEIGGTLLFSQWPAAPLRGRLRLLDPFSSSPGCCFSASLGRILINRDCVTPRRYLLSPQEKKELTRRNLEKNPHLKGEKDYLKGDTKKHKYLPLDRGGIRDAEELLFWVIDKEWANGEPRRLVCAPKADRKAARWVVKLRLDLGSPIQTGDRGDP